MIKRWPGEYFQILIWTLYSVDSSASAGSPYQRLSWGNCHKHSSYPTCKCTRKTQVIASDRKLVCLSFELQMKQLSSQRSESGISVVYLWCMFVAASDCFALKKKGNYLFPMQKRRDVPLFRPRQES